MFSKLYDILYMSDHLFESFSKFMHGGNKDIPIKGNFYTTNSRVT